MYHFVCCLVGKTHKILKSLTAIFTKLEDLKRSPDLLNNVKVGHGQLRFIIQTFCFTLYGHGGHFGQVSYLYLLNTPYEI